VFFLGGVTDATTGTSMNGFSKNPTQPFLKTGNNRQKPFFEFQSSRLVDKDGDTMPEYLDTIPAQTSPILYFSANDGRGYSTFTGASTWCNTDNFNDGWVQNTTFATGSWSNGNWMQRLYFTTYSSSSAAGSVAWQPKKFQIISPGYGGVGAPDPQSAYGAGGLFDPKATSDLSGSADGDNITNFNDGSTLSGE
jgi:hypothetical protein